MRRGHYRHLFLFFVFVCLFVCFRDHYFLFSSFYRASEAGSEFSLFEALRDSIYSEVATLISLNESRPHFLVRHSEDLVFAFFAFFTRFTPVYSSKVAIGRSTPCLTT